ncbi:MAG: hypothetical protein KC609_02335 [Myxococcales bacterium]|nr:hypothetical protein [Myxococcales bacterium]
MRCCHVAPIVLWVAVVALAPNAGAKTTSFCGQAITPKTRTIVCTRAVHSLKPLARLEELRSLELQKGAIGDGELRHLRRLRGLERLILPASKLRGSGLRYLRGSRNSLQILDLSQNPLDSRRLRALATFGALRRLDLHRTPIDDRGFSALFHKRRKLAPIVELRLADTRITSKSMAFVARLSGLTDLDLTNTAVDDNGLRRLLALAALRSVKLEGSCWDEPGVARLKKLIGGRGQVSTEDAVRYIDTTRVMRLPVTRNGKEQMIEHSVTTRRRLKPKHCAGR